MEADISVARTDRPLTLHRLAQSGLWVGFAVAGVVVGVTMALTLPLDASAQTAALHEGGPVETLTVVALLIASLVMLCCAGRNWRFSALASLCIALLAARELDAHKAFTSDGVFKLRYYFDSEIALYERLLAGAIVLSIGVLCAHFAVRNAQRGVSALRSGSSAAWAFALGIGLFIVAKVFDGAHRILGPLDLGIAKGDVRLQLMEESFELAGGALVLTSVAMHALCHRRPGRDDRRIDLTPAPV